MKKSIDRLIREGANYLANDLKLKEGTIKCYLFAWLRIKRFMNEKKIRVYGREIEERYSKELFKGRKDFKKYTKWELALYYRFKALTQFQETGKINPTHRPEKVKCEFKGLVGASIVKFIQHVSEGWKPDNYSSKFYNHQLEIFYYYCEEKKIKSVKRINLKFILDYLKQHSAANKNVRIIFKRFTKFLFEQKLIPLDFHNIIPRGRHFNLQKLPSSYSQKELSVLLSVIDRKTNTGKRNYAMLLLACDLGLRAGDITKLRFEHLLWEIDELRITQSKTGRPLVNPILPHIGNAILEYIKCRPNSEDPYIFLSERPPYKKFTSGSSFSSNVKPLFKKAEININGRKVGTHSLRHSHADRLLKKRTDIGLVGQIYGHSSIASTTPYTRTDLTSLKACVLPVMDVDGKFYDNIIDLFQCQDN